MYNTVNDVQNVILCISVILYISNKYDFGETTIIPINKLQKFHNSSEQMEFIINLCYCQFDDCKVYLKF